MQYFRVEAGKRITLYPLVCWHLGAQQSDERFIKEHVQRITDDPNGRWVYLGDGGECVTKQSKGEVFKQQLSPDEQIDAFVELTNPIASKGLFGISGNHDRRIAKETGLDWTHQLCSRLRLPYLGISAFVQLVMQGHGTTRNAYHCFFHHGVDSSSVLGGKVNAAKRLDRLVWADAVFSAHSHICLDLPPEYVAYIQTPGRPGVGIAYKEVRSFVCGCAYDSRVPGYAEEKGYAPILPAHLAVTFHASTSGRKSGNEQKQMDCQIWRARL